MIYTRRFVKILVLKHGDFPAILTIYAVYTRKFCQDPWSETRICHKSCFFYLYNIRGSYTQILSRSVIRNTQMSKKLFLLFVQYTWFIHANFVKTRDTKHADVQIVVSFICTIYVVFTRKFCQDPWSETRRCQKSSFFYLFNKGWDCIKHFYWFLLSTDTI